MKKKRLLIVLGILLALGIFIGISYAYYLFAISQEGVNIVKTECFQITYTDQDEISLTNSFPMTDANGSQLTPYQFTVKNVCETSQYYEANLETLSSSTINESLIKVKVDNKTPYLYGSNGYADNKVINDSKSAIKIASGSLEKNEERTYELRLWLDESVTVDTPNVQNKSFKSKVTIYASQNNRNFQIAIQRNNTTIKEDRVQGTKATGVQYEFSLDNTDITNATNISCNEDASVTIEDNKLKISNMHENTICKINDTLKSTIDTLDESRTNIKMIKDEDIPDQPTFGANTDSILDLNGKILNFTSLNLRNTGHLVVTSTSEQKGRIESWVSVVSMHNGSDTTFSNVELISKNTGDSSGLCITGKVTINDGTYIEGPYALGCFITNDSYVVINGGEFVSNHYNTIQLNGENITSTPKLVINDGIFTGDKYILANNKEVVNINGGLFNGSGTETTLRNSAGGTINIYGGNFESTDNNTIYNNTDGIINIYGGNFESTNNNTIFNNTDGIININGEQASFENNNYISGTYIHNDNKTVIFNSGGTLTINGGTIEANKVSNQATNPNQTLVNGNNGTVIINDGLLDGGHGIRNNTGTLTINNATIKTYGVGNSSWFSCVCQEDFANVTTINDATIDCSGIGIRNQGKGTINIKNANIKTNDDNAILNNGYNSTIGTINICKINLSGSNKEVRNNNGYIYYSPNAFGNITPNFTGTTANIQQSNSVCN